MAASGACGTLLGLDDYERLEGAQPSGVSTVDSSGSAGGGGLGGGGAGGTGGTGGVPPTCDDGAQNGDETDVDCGGSCAQCKVGDKCAAPGDCPLGYCFDGVCCGEACGLPCRSCALPGSIGDCAPIPDGQDPDDECATTAPSTCGTTGACAGGQCAFHAMGTECAPASCMNGTLDLADTCNGAGTCTAQGSMSCSPYVCNAAGDGCLSMCAAGSDCATAFYCDAMNSCVPQKANGQTCQADIHCTSGHCVDGRCCDTACDATCEACNLSGNLGTCTNLPQGTDDPQCNSPFTTCDANGTCKLPDGASCLIDSDCASNNCQMGTCAP
jgi:hypothetical protein